MEGPSNVVVEEKAEDPASSKTGAEEDNSKKDEGPGGEEKKEEKESPIPTINFSHFTSLLAISGAQNCLCCWTPLTLMGNGPSLLPERREEVLKAFCDIYNLPFGLGRRTEEKDEDEKKDESKGEDSEEEDDKDNEEEFPFCSDCTKSKVLALAKIYERLQAVQEQFERLKDAMMRDILRGFVTNIVMEKKIPVELVRDAKICERMYCLFKRHSSRRKDKRLVDSEVQTDIHSVNTPLMNPTAVASLLENMGGGTPGSSSRGRRRGRPPCHNTNNRLGVLSNKTRGGGNSVISDLFKTPPKKNHSDTYDNSNTQTGIVEESIVSLDEQLVNGDINGMFFSFDDHGVLNFGENNNYSYSNQDTYYNSGGSVSAQSFSNLNGFPTIDDEYQQALGFAETYEPAGNVEEFGGPGHFSRGPPSSPLTYFDLDSAKKTTSNFNVDNELDDEKLQFQCRGCDKRFTRKDIYKLHEERHVVNSKRLYYCHRCVDKNETIRGKTRYIEHCVDIHGVEDDVVEFFYFCDKEDCASSYKVKEDFINHIKGHWSLGESYRCAVCDKTFATKSRYEVHKREAHNSRRAYYDCQFCYRGFHEEEDFTTHLMFHKVKMPEELQYECEHCHKPFETQSRLSRHVYTAHTRKGTRGGQWKVVPTTSEDSLSVQNDEEVQSVKLDFSCEECGKTYSSEKKLKKHSQRHRKEGRKRKKHEEESSDDEIPDAGEIDQDEEDEDYPSPGKKPRKTSIKIKIKKPVKPVDHQHGNIVCDFCPRTFKTSVDLRRHQSNTHKEQFLDGGKVFCVVCYKVFPSQEELEEHCDEKHSRYKCKICNRQCQNGSTLREHMKRHNRAPNTGPT